MALTTPTNDLTGNTVASTYDQILFIDGAALTNSALFAVACQDGETALHVANDQILIKDSSGTDIASLFEVQDKDANVILSINGTNNKVGIGTVAPSFLLSVVHAADPILSLARNDGGQPTANERLGSIHFSGTANGTTFGEGASISAYADETWTVGSAEGTYLSFFTTDNTTHGTDERMRIDHNGKIGIGASDPDYTLDVNGNIGIRTAAGQTLGLEIGYGGSAYGSVKYDRHASSLGSSIGMEYTVTYGDHTFIGASARELMYIEGGHASNNPGVVTFHTEAANTVFEALSSNKPRVVIENNFGLMWECDNDASDADSRAYMIINDLTSYGDLRIISSTARNNTISTSVARLAIDHDGDLEYVSQTLTSDERLKKNIKNVENGLSTINSLQGRTFEWKTSTHNGTGTKYGFIAQEIEQVVPDLVKNTGGTHQISETEWSKSVNTSGIIPILVEAVKELSAKVTALENA